MNTGLENEIENLRGRCQGLSKLQFKLNEVQDDFEGQAQVRINFRRASGFRTPITRK